MKRLHPAPGGRGGANMLNIDPGVVAAAGDFGISVLCLLELARRIKPFAGTMMELQFLAVHSFPFMVIMVSNIERPAGKRALFAFLAVFYSLFAWGVAGLFGIAQFAGLTFFTYYGVSFRKDPQKDVESLMLRWLASFALFLSLALGTGMPTGVDYWGRESKAPFFAMLYFLAMGFMELIWLYYYGWKEGLKPRKRAR